jgi:Domain of unknown function (DUF6249)
MRGRHPRLEANVHEQQIILGVFLPVLTICVFSFVSIVVWSAARRREREAFYRSETMKKLAESAGTGGTTVLEIMREQERAAVRSRRSGHKLGGLISVAIGMGLITFLAPLGWSAPVFLVGIIPMFVGAALLAYAYLFDRRE